MRRAPQFPTQVFHYGRLADREGFAREIVAGRGEVGDDEIAPAPRHLRRGLVRLVADSGHSGSGNRVPHGIVAG